MARGWAFCATCGLCCRDTEMPLTPRDVERIEALGYGREEFSVERGGVRYLRNVDGKCFFYEDGRGCRIYPYRPLGCSVYPVVLDAEEGRPVADPYCPMAPLVPERWLREAEPVLRLVLRQAGLGKRDKGEVAPYTRGKTVED